MLLIRSRQGTSLQLVRLVYHAVSGVVVVRMVLQNSKEYIKLLRN